MLDLAEQWAANRDLLESGGIVLGAILFVAFVMWALIVERYWYLATDHRRAVGEVTAEWRARIDTSSWYAHQIRRAMISRVSRRLNRTIPMVRTLVVACPLLGLLGTVNGMIEVFDAMSVAGNTNPRAVASGVSEATLTTMAGMVAALSGFIFSVQLQRRSRDETERLAAELSPGE